MKRHSPPAVSTTSSGLILPTKSKKSRPTTKTPLASSPPPPGSPPYTLNVMSPPPPSFSMLKAGSGSRSRSQSETSESVFRAGRADSVASGSVAKRIVSRSKKPKKLSKREMKRLEEDKEVELQRERERTASTSMFTADPNGAASVRSGVSARSAEEDAEVEDENLLYSDDEFGRDQRANERMKEDLRVLMGHFDEAQMDRYESFRRSGLTKGSVRKNAQLVNQVLQQVVADSILTVVRGFSKVFVGEIVEKAREVANHSGPLAPADLREAYRLYQIEHDGGAKKKMFIK